MREKRSGSLRPFISPACIIQSIIVDVMVSHGEQSTIVGTLRSAQFSVLRHSLFSQQLLDKIVSRV